MGPVLLCTFRSSGEAEPSGGGRGAQVNVLKDEVSGAVEAWLGDLQESSHPEARGSVWLAVQISPLSLGM